jgi:hypothetical protein
MKEIRTGSGVKGPKGVESVTVLQRFYAIIKCK